MKRGPITSARSSRKRDLGRGATAVIAVMAQPFASRVTGATPVAIEIAQLRLADGKHATHPGCNAGQRRVRGQLGRDLALGDKAVQRAVEDMLRAEIFHALDAKREFDQRRAVEKVLGQEIL